MISTRSSTNSKAKLSFIAAALLAANFLSVAHSADYPVTLHQIPNLNDYTLFANGGWDGNWFVGYTNTWVKKLPPPPAGQYSRAYIGVRLGRAKTLPPVGRPPVFNPIPGEVWAAVASTSAWPSKSQVKVATTEEIPLEPGAEYALEHVGESQWFWAEVPVDSINMKGDNFVAVWSPSPQLVTIASSPVIAAGWGGKESSAWLVENTKGAPPSDPSVVMKKPLSYFQPGIALKLIPAGPAHPLSVRVVSWQNGTADFPKPVVTVSVDGESVERVWVERNDPIRRGDVIRGNWVPVGRPQWKAPYVFSIDQTKLPKGRILLRVSAANVWEETASTKPFEIEVGEKRAK